MDLVIQTARTEPLDMELLKFLYEKNLQEEHFNLDEQQKRIAFFAGLISAIFGGTIAGMLHATHLEELAALSLGPVLIIALARMACRAAGRFYRRFLEVISLRAKIEFELGLAGERDLAPHWMGSGPLIAKRHFESRISRKDDQEFVLRNERGGYQAITVGLFRTTEVIAAILLVLLASKFIVILIG
jgi:hypothetical protein